MFGSENNFFKQDKNILIKKREQLKFILTDVWGVDSKIYLEAYDYFLNNPNDYDGATIVNDLTIMPNLDIWAMFHDYLYIKFNVAVNLKYKHLADLKYCQEMRKFKISWGSVWLVRYVGLLISTIYFTPREILITKKKFTQKNKKDLLKYLNL